MRLLLVVLAVVAVAAVEGARLGPGFEVLLFCGVMMHRGELWCVSFLPFQARWPFQNVLSSSIEPLDVTGMRLFQSQRSSSIVLLEVLCLFLFSFLPRSASLSELFFSQCSLESALSSSPCPSFPAVRLFQSSSSSFVLLKVLLLLVLFDGLPLRATALFFPSLKEPCSS